MNTRRSIGLDYEKRVQSWLYQGELLITEGEGLILSLELRKKTLVKILARAKKELTAKKKSLLVDASPEACRRCSSPPVPGHTCCAVHKAEKEELLGKASKEENKG